MMRNIIAALDRTIRWNERDSDGSRTDAALLRALVDVLREARTVKQDEQGCNCGRGQMPADRRYAAKVWIIPEPKVKE